jgi:hypothetical protein
MREHLQLNWHLQNSCILLISAHEKYLEKLNFEKLQVFYLNSIIQIEFSKIKFDIILALYTSI